MNVVVTSGIKVVKKSIGKQTNAEASTEPTGYHGLDFHRNQGNSALLVGRRSLLYTLFECKQLLRTEGLIVDLGSCLN